MTKFYEWICFPNSQHQQRLRGILVRYHLIYVTELFPANIFPMSKKNRVKSSFWEVILLTNHSNLFLIFQKIYIKLQWHVNYSIFKLLNLQGKFGNKIDRNFLVFLQNKHDEPKMMGINPSVEQLITNQVIIDQLILIQISIRGKHYFF